MQDVSWFWSFKSVLGGGLSDIPPLAIETVVIENILEIISKDIEPIDTAIELCLYCMKTQIFNDGNKRASVIFANHYLISKAGGLPYLIRVKRVSMFSKIV